MEGRLCQVPQWRTVLMVFMVAGLVAELPQSDLLVDPLTTTLASPSTAASSGGGEVPVLNCSAEVHLVNGADFNVQWPNYSLEVWNTNNADAQDAPDVLQQQSASTTPWLLLQKGGDEQQNDSTQQRFNALIRAPPKYKSRNRPRGLRLVMIGDSLMRYQFVMLIHYLHTGEWIHDSMQPNPLHERSFTQGGRRWDLFFRALTTYYGQDHLVCDCFRSASQQAELRNPTMVENQFYRNPGCLDNSVAMIWKAGDLGFRGYHTPLEINAAFFSNSSSVSDQEDYPKLSVPTSQYRKANFTWRYSDYEPFLREVLVNLRPRPRVVMLNEGKWGVQNLSNETVVRQIQNTLKDLGMISIYKTTTKSSNERNAALLPHDELCCQIFDHCLRMDWTAHVDPTEYFDNHHFRAYPNVRFNEQLFELLLNIGEIPNDVMEYDA